MEKKFTRIEPTTTQEFGDRFVQQAVIKRFQTEDGLTHEFTTVYEEGSRSAAVVALTPDNQVITIFQFRAGPEKWVYDLPGGGVNSDEDVESGVLRELREEAGYAPSAIEFLGEGYGDGYTNIRFHYFYATDCVPEEGGQRLDKEERDQGVEVRLLTIEEFIEKAKYGEMSDPHAVLLAYDRLKALESR